MWQLLHPAHAADSYTQLSTIPPEQPTAPVCVCEHIYVRVSQTAHKNRLVPLSVWTQQPQSAKSRSRLLRPKIKSHPSRKYHHFLNLIPFIAQNLPTSWIFCSLAGRINKWIPAEALKDQCRALFALSQWIKLWPFLPSHRWTCAVLQAALFHNGAVAHLTGKTEGNCVTPRNVSLTWELQSPD